MMNAQRLGTLIRPHNLTSPFIVLFSLLVLAFGPGAGAAQPAQDGAAGAASDEREFINAIPAHIPVKVKLRNEQTFKKKGNKNWARELEVEIKNTGAKPIYFMYMVVNMPDVRGENGHPYAFQLHYGRKELMDLAAPLLPGDVPVLPGESVTLKPYESRVAGYEAMRRSKNKDDPKKVRFGMQIINFGDGTGLHGMTGTPEPRPARKRSQVAPAQEGTPGDYPPRFKEWGSPGKSLKAFYSPVPASLLRVNFSPAETAPTIQLPGGCTNCQHSNDCMWGRHGFPDCPCDDTSQFPSVMSVNSCGSTSGSCLRVITITRPCPTRFNGTQFCQFQEFTGECSEGDPTPSPTPEPTATPPPDPNATPTAERPNANHDGLSAPEELHALPSLDVVRLRLDYKVSKRVDAHGNRFRYRAKVDDAKGSKVNRWAWDVFLVRER
jgi:hypothetical protein